MATVLAKVLVYSHHFEVSRVDPRMAKIIIQFMQEYVEWGEVKQGRRWGFGQVRLYGLRNLEKTVFRIHRNAFDKFRRSMVEQGYEPFIEYLEVALPVTTDVELPIFAKWKDRDKQPLVIEYLTQPVPPGPRSKLVHIQPGAGKSYCTMRAASIMKAVTAYIFKPSYIDKWLKDLRKTYDIPFEDVMVIQGSKDLKKVLELAADGLLEAKILIFSNRTLQNWFKLYKHVGDDVLNQGYACLPQEMFAHLGVRLRVIDEVHQDFHFNFILDLYTHVENSVSLSATLISKNAFNTKMYELAYPRRIQYIDTNYKRYVSAKALMYTLRKPEEVSYKDKVRKTYSHHIFETSIMKDHGMLMRYMELIKTMIEDRYIDGRKPGDKCLIFVASIMFATILTDWLAKQYPYLKVHRYVEDDDYEQLMTGELTVSTLLSAGTAVDVEQLVAAIMTVAVSSSQSNVQGFGRTRELPDGRNPSFTWFVCRSIQKHIDYHEDKVRLLQDRVASYNVIQAGACV